MKSLEIRRKFFDFFMRAGHEKVASSSLIPAQDPTLLFANAGMNQFKDLFLGKEKRSYTRAVSIQKCVRAGGKHNDLDNVGFTKRHLTFFEMMGNFSFGDYFKKEAIEFAWMFLTKELGLPQDKLYASVFEKDDEAYNMWHTVIGLPQERIVRLGAADNFWQMGDTGPCGPCTEIYIDRGAALGCGKKDCAPGCSCDRFLEIWNNVFMQFDRQPDGTDKPLKQTGVDTGMGLERLCAVMQNKDSVFNTDLFMPLIEAIEHHTGLEYEKQDVLKKAAFHVLADHIRSSALLIADGASPSNEGRGYVLRKIIRRAALFAQKLTDKNIFPELVTPLNSVLGTIYPELDQNLSKIKAILTSEIEKFSLNLVRGQAILDEYMRENTDKKISGTQAFKLYDTFGFPLELVHIIANERGFSVDMTGFEREMEIQRHQSGKKIQTTQAIELDPSITTTFTGYQTTTTPSTIAALIVDDQVVTQVPAGQACWIICKESPFYVESGGQVSDHGTIEVGTATTSITELKKINGAIAIACTAPVPLALGQKIVQKVDEVRRRNAMKNHTATHLLQAALLQVLGKQIKQSGSLVDPDYLRFDFTYHENPSPKAIDRVETLINEKIMENIPVQIEESTYKDAVDKGVIAFFGEKYNPEKVRVVKVPGFSAELCGGTHVRATGDIGSFKIVELSALSAGNRRIVALTGPKALERFQSDHATVKKLATEFKVKPQEVIGAVEKQTATIKQMLTDLKGLKKQLVSLQLPVWLQQIKTVHNLPFLILELAGMTGQELKEISEQLVAKTPGLFVLIGHDQEKSSFVVNLASTYSSVFSIKTFKTWLEQECSFKGGGSATSLQGGAGVFQKKWLELITQAIERGEFLQK